MTTTSALLHYRLAHFPGAPNDQVRLRLDHGNLICETIPWPIDVLTFCTYVETYSRIQRAPLSSSKAPGNIGSPHLNSGSAMDRSTQAHCKHLTLPRRRALGSCGRYHLVQDRFGCAARSEQDAWRYHVPVSTNGGVSITVGSISSGNNLRYARQRVCRTRRINRSKALSVRNPLHIRGAHRRAKMNLRFAIDCEGTRVALHSQRLRQAAGATHRSCSTA